MSTALGRLNTVGVIAGRAGSTLHRVEYIIRARGITPEGMAGNARVFSEEDVERIIAELKRIGTPRHTREAVS
jgi:hypothetical protein